MSDIIGRAGCFVAMILLGCILRRIGFFKKSDFYLLSKIAIKITLTAVIINNFAGRQIAVSMLSLAVIALVYSGGLILIVWLLSLRRTAEDRAFAVLNIAGCNVGNFTLPFVQSFLGPAGVLAVSLFDTGNSIVCLGGTYGLASMIKEERSRFSLRPVIRALLNSPPFLAYISMTVLCLLHISLPALVVEFTGIIANANAFLAMLSIGVGFDLNGDASYLRMMVRILGLRYALSAMFATLCYFLLPFPLEWRQALVVLVLSPVASSAPSYTAQMGGESGVACAINSFSILISIVLVTLSLTVML